MGPGSRILQQQHHVGGSAQDRLYQLENPRQRLGRPLHVSKRFQQYRHEFVQPLPTLSLQRLQGAGPTQVAEGGIAAFGVLKTMLIEPDGRRLLVHFTQPKFLPAVIKRRHLVLFIFDGDDIRKMRGHPSAMLLQFRNAGRPIIKPHDQRYTSSGQIVFRQQLGLLVFHALKGMFKIAKEHIGLLQLLHHC